MLYENPRGYDHIHDSFAEDIPFWIEVSRRAIADVPGGTVWELGCGSGRVTVPVALAGIPVVGVDAQPEMIDAAGKRAAAAGLDVGNPCFHVGSMEALPEVATQRQTPEGTPVAAAIIPLHSLSHLLEPAAVGACLQGIFRLLAPGGVLALAVHLPDLETLQRDPAALFPLDLGPGILAHEQSRYDAVTQILHCRWWWEVDGEPEEGGPHLHQFDLRMFFPRELETLLTCAGFVVEERWGWYDRTPLTSARGTQIVVARRPLGRP